MDLFKLTSKSFEQFMLALSTEIFGPGVKVYGSGSDGGREGTFNGNVPYPSTKNCWNGYGVIQAKCKEKTEGTQKDQEWALEQLKSELDDFVNSDEGQKYNKKTSDKNKSTKKRVRLPEYYVFCTNVILTPFPESGGKDRADKLVKSYFNKLPLKDFAIWDQDQISTYINKYESLRRSFSFFLTGSDLIASVIKQIEATQFDYDGVCQDFITRCFLKDQDSRLEQGGDSSDYGTALANVFIDLTASENRENDTSTTEQSERGLLVELLDAGDCILDQRSINVWNDIDGNYDSGLSNKYLVIGGPGSGKSTLGQFLAQIYRASWLEGTNCDNKTKGYIEQIKTHCRSSNFHWPNLKRIPFRIELHRYATELANADAKSEKLSLARYFLNLFSPEELPSKQEFLKWFSKCPLLIILDGLDEIPTSSNRTEVCEEVQDFINENSRLNTNILLLATTRLEGYNNEFGNQSYRTKYLQPLSMEQALNYAKLIFQTKFRDNAERVQEFLSILKTSCSHDLTTNLMKTPLQVTFMTTLVLAGGSPPRDRWKLFREYYDVIYKREKQKCDGKLRGILESHSNIIDSLHYKVAFILHVRSENASNTTLEFDIQEFEALIKQQLAEDEWPDERSNEICKLILEAATNRLIFLTCITSDKISFSLQSLQEFMVSEYLTSGTESKISPKLEAIIKSGYWRNVFLFVTGKYFTNTQSNHLQPLIISLCENLNGSDGDQCISNQKIGSSIILDLIDDGALLKSPKHTKKSLKIGFEALEVPLKHITDYAYGSDPVTRLRDFIKTDYAPIDLCKEEVERRLLMGNCHTVINTWRLLVGLLVDGEEWALELADEYWDFSSPEKEYQVLSELESNHIIHEWVWKKIERLVPIISPRYISSMNTIHFPYELEKNNAVPKWLRTFMRIQNSGPKKLLAELNIAKGDKCVGASFCVLTCSAVRDMFSELVNIPNPCEEWSPIICAVKFALTPDLDTLVEQIDILHQTRLLDDTDIELLLEKWFPWQFSSSLIGIKNGTNCTELLNDLRSKIYGDSGDWDAAELRWHSKGLVVSDFIDADSSPTGFTNNIATLGFPFLAPLSLSFKDGYDIKECMIEVEKLFPKCIQNANRGLAFLYQFVRAGLMIGDHNSEKHFVDPKSFKEMFLSENSLLVVDLKLISYIDWVNGPVDEWVTVLNEMGSDKAGQIGVCVGDSIPDIALEKLTEAFIVDPPNRSGLLILISKMCSLGMTTVISEVLLGVEKYNCPRLKSAVLNIMVANMTEKTDAEKLIDDILLIHQSNSMMNIFKLLLFSLKYQVESTGLSQEKIKFVALLEKKIPADLYRDKAVAIEILNYVARNKSSEFQDEDLLLELDLQSIRKYSLI